MKRFISFTSEKFKNIFFKSAIPEGVLFLERGRCFYKMHEFQDALVCLNKAISLGLDSEVYELRARCYQKMNCHETAIEDFDKAIEILPFKFSNYYGRSLSKKEISDYAGQAEDLHSTLYYYKKNSNLDSVFLKELEAEFLTVKINLDKLPQKVNCINRRSIIEIKLLVRNSLMLITSVRFGSLKSRIPTNKMNHLI